MSVRRLFASLLYEDQLDDADLLAEIEQSCWALAEDDRAGRRWSKEHGYRGYTSYASLNDLPIRDPVFADLKKKLDRHVARFAEECAIPSRNTRTLAHHPGKPDTAANRSRKRSKTIGASLAHLRRFSLLVRLLLFRGKRVHPVLIGLLRRVLLLLNDVGVHVLAELSRAATVVRPLLSVVLVRVRLLPLSE